MVIGAGQYEKISFDTVQANALGEFSAFTVGILYWYKDLSGEAPEDHVWLYFNGNELRQDFAFSAHGYELYRPSDDEDGI
jgi:hypothetical protein